MADNCCIVALGDSLTEGFGVPPEGSFPARLDGLLRRRGTDCRVINMGRSGDTCRGVLARLSQVLALAPDLVILEIGLNDVLMGAMVERIELNISRIVERLTAARARVLLAGMVLPPMGEPDGESAFAGIYPRVAAANGVGLIPGFNAPA
ncbi:MAG: GDSL-type esterase/lipase family protein, partial [Desulfobacterales bacterium]